MTSVPPPDGPGWSFQQDEPRPDADSEPGTGAKPKHTGLLLTLGIVVGLLVVAGASTGLLHATTGSYLPGVLTSDAPRTPSPESSSSKPPEATPSPTPTAESTAPAVEPAVAFQAVPEPNWQVDGPDLFKAANLDAPKNASVQFINSTPGTTENTSGVQTVQSWAKDTQLVAGIDVQSGAVLWTYTSTGSSTEYGPNACFLLDGGDTIGCATSSEDDDGAALVFLTTTTGKVIAETVWDADVRIIAGSPKNLFIGGITDNEVGS